jgi:hypothetical protein
MKRLLTALLSATLLATFFAGTPAPTFAAATEDYYIGYDDGPGGTGNGGTAYFRADTSYIYGAFDITGWTAAMGASSHGNILGFGVWDANNGHPTAQGVEFAQSTSWPSKFSINTIIQGSVPGDLQAMDSFATGNRVWEVKMPIGSMGVSVGQTIWAVGGINYEGQQHWYPDSFFPGYNGYAPITVETHIPDGGLTLVLLGSALTGLAALRRKLIA